MIIRGVVHRIYALYSVLKIVLLILFALFFPRFFLFHINTNNKKSLDNTLLFKLGLENLTVDFLKHLTVHKDLAYGIGLITNQTGRDQQGRSNVDILQEKGARITKIFTPEHGFGTFAQKDTIPIISLYDNNHRSLDNNLLTDVDVLIFDIQDAGMRHYSYLGTLFHALQAASDYNKIIVVLDRPNLLGSLMEGITINHKTQLHIPIPVRYGMTVGEIARYLNKHVLSVPAQLRVVSMSNYERHAWIGNLPYQLSPHITTLHSCYGYSFLGLIGEVAPFDIGVGTQEVFQCILLPDSSSFSKTKWYELQAMLKKLGVESVFYRYFSKRKKEYCSGLRLYISHIDQFSSFSALLMTLKFFKNAGLELSFSPNFDQVLGGAYVREFVQGKIAQEAFEELVNKELKLFFNKAMSSFLYKPFPKIVMV